MGGREWSAKKSADRGEGKKERVGQGQIINVQGRKEGRMSEREDKRVEFDGAENYLI